MTNKRLDSLTPEQEARFDEYVDRFVAAGYSTERADRPAVEDAARRIYEVADKYTEAGEKRCIYPKNAVYWYPSPAAALKDARKMSRGKATADDFCFGQHEAGWLSRYAFFREVCGFVENTEDIVPHIDMCFAGGWWMPYDDRVLFCERPVSIHLDNEGNLHNTVDAALKFEDGFGVYAVRGVLVPPEWITREPPSVKDCLTWPNMEQRNAACEIRGWDNMNLLNMPELGAKILDEDADPIIGTLFSVQLPDAEGRDKFLRARCGTGRMFTIPVSRDIKSALEAQSKIWRLPKNIVRDYLIRT